MKHPDPFYWQKLRQRSLASNPLKRSGVKRKAVKIRKVSKKREKELREYEKVKAEFFKTVTECQYPGCHETEIEVHHAFGRCGKFLTDIDTFRGLCRYHHNVCEMRPIEAKALGLSGNRLEVR